MKTKLAVFGLIAAFVLATSSVAAPKIVNLSTRGQVGSGQKVLIGGFVIAGTAPKKVLVRGIGPGLTQFKVPGPIAAPKLALYNSKQEIIAENGGWDGSAATQLLFLQLGAFRINVGSADTALVMTLQPGAYTCVMSSKDSSEGVGLIEIYDAEKLSNSWLLNESARVVSDGNTIITGIVLEGIGTQTLLVRSVGPALKGFGLTETMLNPTVTIYNSVGGVIANNDDWKSGNSSPQTFSKVGAFPLDNDHLSSAREISLTVNGETSITIHTNGIGGSPGKPDTGTVLSEIYLVP